MSEVDLYNLAPVFQLMAVGLAVAALPLGWWLWQQRSATPSGRLKALTLITLFLTFDLVLFGAFTRLTDSGLGCPGQVVMAARRQSAPKAKSLRPRPPCPPVR